MDQSKNQNIQLVSIPSVGLVSVNMDNYKGNNVGLTAGAETALNTEFDSSAYIEQEAAKVAAMENQKKLNESQTWQKITELNKQKAALNEALAGAAGEAKAIILAQIAAIDAQLAAENAQLINQTAATTTNASVKQVASYATEQAIAQMQAQAMAQAQAQATVAKIMGQNSNIHMQPGLTAGGFVMPNQQQLDTIYRIIAAEGGSNNPQEALNIASTMINRARGGNWPGGHDLFSVATARDQYVVFQNGSYKSSMLSPESTAAVNSLLLSTASGGPTSHIYSSFRSNGSSKYGGTILVAGGNRYK